MSTLHAQEKSSILLPIPSNLRAYEMPYAELSANQKWNLRRHSIRYAMLHPETWGLLKINKTENRTLVPIRPFYLRASENSNFSLNQIELDFEFQNAKTNYMRLVPHFKDPVFEIGIGQVIEQSPLSLDGKRNNGYSFRLSAFSQVPSGGYFHSNGKYLRIAKPAYQHLKVGTPYKIKIEVSKNESNLFVNNELFIQIKDQDLEKGLVSLETSWHPVLLSKLKISAFVDDRSSNFSGLVEQNISKELNSAQ
ncbi:MAG: hypothetical protein KDD56_03160 [Bdellovibrionales bacterium]|nr:hypothetical protein [Bdellovibrionales bacterium]